MKDFIKSRLAKKIAFLLSNLFTIVLVIVSLSFASNGEEASDLGPKLIDMGLRILNFSILIGILVYFLRKPLRDFLTSRRDKIEGTIKEADDSLSAVKDEYKESEKRLDRIAEEVRQISDRLKHEGQLEKEKIIKNAYEMAQKIKDQTEKTIRREFDLIHRKVKEETIEHTINIAEETLKGKFEPTDQEKFADMVAEEISKAGDVNVFLQNPISSSLKKKVPIEIDPNKKVSEATMGFIKLLIAADHGDAAAAAGDDDRAGAHQPPHQVGVQDP